MNLRNNTFIRTLVKPYVDRKKRRDHDQYLHSSDHFYLKTLKGIHQGKRCFIIGNGPSLRASDLDMLRGEFTFAANRIFKIFEQTEWRPTYYIAVDDKILADIRFDFQKYDLGHLFLRYGKSDFSGPTNLITKIFLGDLYFNARKNLYYDTTKYFSEDVSDHFCDGITVTFEAIQLAVYMGFNEIYLLGVDHNYSRTVDPSGKIILDTAVQDYFDNNYYYENTYPADLNTTQYSYKIAREYCDNHGIKICNATRGGKLEVFERIDFDTLFNNQ